MVYQQFVRKVLRSFSFAGYPKINSDFAPKQRKTTDTDVQGITHKASRDK